MTGGRRRAWRLYHDDADAFNDADAFEDADAFDGADAFDDEEEDIIIIVILNIIYGALEGACSRPPGHPATRPPVHRFRRLESRSALSCG